jgi:tRNA-uridine 2-sulfurtransferase
MVAMSGGVDSSVAAWLLREQGYSVVGVTFKLFTNAQLGCDEDRACCSEATTAAARGVCQYLGLPHYTLSFVDEFRRHVLETFVAEYAAGRTPNPCVVCNRDIKFDLFLKKALATGADLIATGHYARIEREGTGYRLLPGVDTTKDQSYALCHLNQSTMPHVLLPIGQYTKQQVRQIAREQRLPTAETPESQDICFAPEGSYREFLQQQGVVDQPGSIVTPEGRVLGEHRGLSAYTVGQRKGLGLAGGPWFVIAKRVADSTLVVGSEAQAARSEVLIEQVNWCSEPEDGWGRAPARLVAQVRYRCAPVGCEVAAQDPHRRTLTLRFAEPVIAAPGQYAVLYDAVGHHVVVGGAIA